MADGSADFTRDDIDQSPWRAMSTVAGAEAGE
jgi:hypothetical protein